VRARCSNCLHERQYVARSRRASGLRPQRAFRVQVVYRDLRRAAHGRRLPACRTVPTSRGSPRRHDYESWWHRRVWVTDSQVSER
jgi:hypothetical protein